MGEKDTAELLRESEELRALLVSRIRDYAIFMLSPDGTILTWNPGAELLKGYRSDEIIGRSFSTFYTPQDVERKLPAQLLEKAAREGRVEDEGWRVRKDGTRFWADVVITALHDEDGTLRGFAKITRDLTERRKAEAAIGELSGRLFRLQDEERQRLAKQLHDRTSPYLTAVLASLHRVKNRFCTDDAAAAAEVSDSIVRVEAASDVIRRVAYMLHPSRLELGGLVETLRWYFEAVTGHLGIPVDAELPSAPIKMSQEGEIALFRLVQECLSHMVGRGDAREVTVRLSGEGVVTLEITIHGALPPGLRESLTIGRGDFGVAFAGIRERLRQLGGTLTLSVGSSKAIVQTTLPLER